LGERLERLEKPERPKWFEKRINLPLKPFRSFKHLKIVDKLPKPG
jgi:hypothetical protein